MKDKNIDEKDEKRCYKKCFRFNNCVLDYYMSISYSSNEDEPLVQEYVNSIFIGYAMSHFEFWMQLTGLITLFFSLNVFSTLPGLIRLIFIGMHLEKNEIYEKYFRKIRYSLIILTLLTAISLCVYILIDYFFRSEIIRTKMYDFSRGLEPFSVVFCLPVQKILFSSENFTLKKDDFILKNYDFEKIERLTRNGSSQLINRAVVNYGSREVEYDYKLSNDPLFVFTTYKFIGRNDKKMIRKPSSVLNETNLNLLSRCFRMDSDFSEPRYQSLITISTLNIALKHLFINVYIVVKDQQFIMNSSFLYLNEYKLLRKYTTSSVCTNYTIYKTCETQSECINECINDRFGKMHESLPINTVINKQLFKNNSKSLSYHFNPHIDEEINRQCKELHNLNDCQFTFYADSLKPLISFLAKKDNSYYLNMVINLYSIETEENETSPSFMKTVLSIFNVESIFFSVSVIKVLNLFLTTIKINHLKAFKYAINIICSVCLLTHFYVIFYSLIDDDLMTSGFYERNETSFCPDEMFCFHVNQELIDPNIKLTVQYLENVTSNITFEMVFEKLIFVKKGKLYSLDFREFKEENDNFKIFTVFYHNMKCLILRTYITYRFTEFSFIANPLYAFPIALYLNKSFDKNTNVYFLSKRAGSYEFTELNLLKIKDDNNRKLKYQIRHELLEISINDQFTYIKKPLSIFYKSNNLLQATSYLSSMKENFQRKYEHTSLLTVEVGKDNHFEIDDNLFHQFYLQEQNVTDHRYPNNPNSIRQVFNNYIQFSKIEKSEGEQEADFDFFCSFFVLKTVVTNKDTLAKLIQQILNSLSTWFNICLLDLHTYLFKLLYIFLFIYNNLIGLRCRFKIYLIHQIFNRT